MTSLLGRGQALTSKNDVFSLDEKTLKEIEELKNSPERRKELESRFEPSPAVPAYFPLDGHPLAFVAQSPGKNEVDQGIPLVGAAGQLTEECAKLAGIPWERCFRSNVIQYRPPGNDFRYFCAKKKADVGGNSYPYPGLGMNGYLRPVWFDQLDRLKAELLAYKPNVVVALGNEALWALTRQTGITKWRGAVLESTLIPGLKVLPTFHPANALREYEHRTIIARDLVKAAFESSFPEIRRRKRRITIYPSIDDLWEWERKHKPQGEALLSVDIETKANKFITCIGFAFTSDDALVVPFWSDLREGNSYWRTQKDEEEAWEFVQHMLSTYPVLGQNHLAYDMIFMLFTMGIVVKNLRHDTMIQHAAYQPELPKGLAFTSSIYCNEPAYKTLKPKGKGTEKRDE